MRRPGQYGDAGVNPMMAAQMQQMSAQTQRMQYNSGVGNYAGHPDEEHQYMASKAERQWQWDMDSKGAKPMSPDMYKAGTCTVSSFGKIYCMFALLAVMLMVLNRNAIC